MILSKFKKNGKNNKEKFPKGEIYFISGISGAGKTTIGKKLAEMFNCVFMDQDLYYRIYKPTTVLSSGERVINYDNEGIMDWDKMNLAIESQLEYSNVVLVGYALWKEKLKFSPKVHFLLIRDILNENNQHNLENLVKFCYEDRQKSSRFRGKDNEMMMVKELVVPFYFKTLSKIGPAVVINTMYSDGENNYRLSVDQVLELMRDYIK